MGPNSESLVIPRKPRFKGNVKSEKSMAGDRRSIGVYLNTFLRNDLDSLPPVLLSFLEIRENEALRLSSII